MKKSWESLRLLRKSDFSGPGVFVPTLLYTLLLHLVDASVRQSAPMLYRLLFVLIIHITVYTVIKFARRYLLPADEGRFQLLKVAGVLIAAAVFRAYLMHYFSEGIELFKTDNFLFRVTNSVQNMPIAFAVSAVATEAYHEWQERRDTLVKDNARLRQLIQNASVIAKVEHQRLVDTVTGQLLRFVREVERSKPGEIIDNLRNGIATIVRPLSQEIDSHEFEEIQPKSKDTSIGFWQVMRGVENARPLEPLLMPLAVIWIGTPYLVNNIGWAAFGPFFLSVALVATSVYSLFQLLITRLQVTWAGVWFLVLVAALFTAVFESLAVTAVLDRFDLMRQLMVVLLTFNLLWSVMFTVTTGIIRQLEVLERQLKDTSEQLTWALAREIEVQRQHSRNLAIALHGPVQSAVGASIIRLEMAALEGEISQALIAEVSELIYNSLEELQDDDAIISLDKVREDVIATWQGIAEIISQTSPQAISLLAKDPVATRLVSELVPELAFNAIKHGGASRIVIAVDEPKDRRVAVSIVDNGTAFEAKGSGGLGLRHLNESALSVTRTRLDGQNLTEIVLPFDEAAVEVAPIRVNP